MLRTPSRLTAGGGRRWPLSGVVWLLAAWIGLTTPALAEAQEASPAEAKQVVSLVIDYGDGAEKHFTALPWRKGMTVLDALDEARKHPRGIRYEHRGTGATVFVTQIDDLTNEGAGRNWTYRVNDKPATRSCGIFELLANDAILWRFK
jgi:hypothetical protein